MPRLVKVWLLRSDGVPARYLTRPNNPKRITAKQAAFIRQGKERGIRLERAAKVRQLRNIPDTPKRARAPAPTRGPAGPRRAQRDTPIDLPIPAGMRVEKPSGRSGARFFTHFKAFGTVGALADMRQVESPDLLNEDLEDFNAPAAFYSNQSGILGQARWNGIVPLDVLIERLNDQLQFSGEGSKRFDFREVYPHWEYRYQVTEVLGDERHVIAFEKKRR